MAPYPTKSLCLLHLPSNLMVLKGIMMNNLFPQTHLGIPGSAPVQLAYNLTEIEIA